MRMVRHRTYRRALQRAEAAEQAVAVLVVAIDKLGARIYRDLHVDSESYVQMCDPVADALLADFSTFADGCLEALADARVLAVLSGGTW